MQRPSKHQLLGFQVRLRRTLIGPQTLAFLPAIALSAFWIGGEAGLVAAALGLPLVFSLFGGFTHPPQSLRPRDNVTGLPLRDTLETALEDRMTGTLAARRATACLMVFVDDFDVLSQRHGRSVADHILQKVGQRLRAALAHHDIICRTGRANFGIALAPSSNLDIETAVQIACRLQIAAEKPIILDSTVIYISVCFGFCIGNRALVPSGDGLIEAASTALAEAVRNGPSAIRSYSEDLRKSDRSQHIFVDEVASALENGEILPNFQPQISTDTGRITGFEALARWTHPERGPISPIDFLPVLENAGKLARLSEIMLANSLSALRSWDDAGLDVPTVAVNFSPDELRNPKLIDKVKWELDRYDLTPERLSIEVLETVVAASPEDIIALNINGLARLGCRIDLDDFGTGHASISSIRRFAVQRIKIDRTFVMKVDQDAEQQRMVAAILTMAERLGLETLAEGVETPGEHTMLSQLGCDHVQGFGIARPMPLAATKEWLLNHHARVEDTPKITRGNG